MYTVQDSPTPMYMTEALPVPAPTHRAKQQEREYNRETQDSNDMIWYAMAHVRKNRAGWRRKVGCEEKKRMCEMTKCVIWEKTWRQY